MIKVISKRAKTPDDGVIIDTTSQAGCWSTGLSPFYLGPVELYSGISAKNVENAWQYAKVYSGYGDASGPNELYWAWAKPGWNNNEAVRYPMGRGAKPMYSYWDGHKLGYIDARKQIYVPLYTSAVLKSDAWKKLIEIWKDCKAKNLTLYLRDYDGYKTEASYDYILNDPKHKMGHAFVLANLLKSI